MEPISELQSMENGGGSGDAEGPPSWFVLHHKQQQQQTIYTDSEKREEVVTIRKFHSAEEGGGVTIYIPTLQRERQTVWARLQPAPIYGMSAHAGLRGLQPVPGEQPKPQDLEFRPHDLAAACLEAMRVHVSKKLSHQKLIDLLRNNKYRHVPSRRDLRR